MGLSRGGVSFDQCTQLSASLARIAREADDVTFLKVEVVGDEEARTLAHELNVRKFPTYQYYKARPGGAGIGIKSLMGMFVPNLILPVT